MLKVIQSFDSYNQRRYSTPWVAIVGADGKLNFAFKCGGYTGGYNTGEAGDLYVIDPTEGSIYGWGQKDYRGNYTVTRYAQYRDGEFIQIEKTDLIRLLNENEAKLQK